MPEPTAQQLAALDALRKTDPNLRVEWDEDTGTPALIHGALSSPSPPIGAQSIADAAHDAAYEFLRQNKALYRVPDVDQAFPRSRVVSDEFGSTVHLFQLHQGVRSMMENLA